MKILFYVENCKVVPQELCPHSILTFRVCMRGNFFFFFFFYFYLFFFFFFFYFFLSNICTNKMAYKNCKTSTYIGHTYKYKAKHTE